MSEIDKYGIEFSKLYNRFMRLETLIKERSFDVITKHYKGKDYNEFFTFFKNLYSIAKYSKKDKYGNEFCVLRHIMLQQIPEREKLKKLIEALFLPELLRMILKLKAFNSSDLRQKFYSKSPKNTHVLWQKRFLLAEFRNILAHYNFKLYVKNKKDYWDVLQLFENHLGHNIPGVEQLPYFNGCASTKVILESIYLMRPDLFTGAKSLSYNKDRLLLELFDEIALYNGCETVDLPSPWTILRQMYRFKKENPQFFSSKIV